MTTSELINVLKTTAMSLQFWNYFGALCSESTFSVNNTNQKLDKISANTD